MSEFRRDVLTGQWTIIAEERQARPKDLRMKSDELSDGSICRFCPGHEKETTPEVRAVRLTSPLPDSPGWSIRVIPNKFPILQSSFSHGVLVQHEKNTLGRFDEALAGNGIHELVISAAEHWKDASTYTVDHWDLLLAVCQQRIHELLHVKGIKHVILFENRGAMAGASQSHPHLQLLASPLVPNNIIAKLCNARVHYTKTTRCLFCDLLKREEREGTRMVMTEDSYCSLAPYASRVPYELLILPRAHRKSFTEIPQGERRRLGAHLKDLFQRLHRILGKFSYNWVLHTSPVLKESHDESMYHWHVEIIPRFSQLAGYEWGAGMFVNSKSPELAADELRRMARA